MNVSLRTWTLKFCQNLVPCLDFFGGKEFFFLRRNLLKVIRPHSNARKRRFWSPKTEIFENVYKCENASFF